MIQQFESTLPASAPLSRFAVAYVRAHFDSRTLVDWDYMGWDLSVLMRGIGVYGSACWEAYKVICKSHQY